MNEKIKLFVHKYWKRTELGRLMINSSSVTDDDLLFLIPNNAKRIHGLRATRTVGKHKAKTKRRRKRLILTFRLFDVLEEVISERISTQLDEDYFKNFVDLKNVNQIEV